MHPDLRKLLDSLSQRADVPHPEQRTRYIADSRDLALHNEEGVAFENLCQNLFEWDFPLTTEDFVVIERLGRHYQFKPDKWGFLAKLLKTSR